MGDKQSFGAIARWSMIDKSFKQSHGSFAKAMFNQCGVFCFLGNFLLLAILLFLCWYLDELFLSGCFFFLTAIAYAVIYSELVKKGLGNIGVDISDPQLKDVWVWERHEWGIYSMFKDRVVALDVSEKFLRDYSSYALDQLSANRAIVKSAVTWALTLAGSAIGGYYAGYIPLNVLMLILFIILTILYLWLIQTGSIIEQGKRKVKFIFCLLDECMSKSNCFPVEERIKESGN